ncbi:MAG: hypothetical protein KGZ25_15770, partial [Planctomycetes bacterium]|nr:hypothetical protein [Planctomycetota bacterium]
VGGKLVVKAARGGPGWRGSWEIRSPGGITVMPNDSSGQVVLGTSYKDTVDVTPLKISTTNQLTGGEIRARFVPSNDVKTGASDRVRVKRGTVGPRAGSPPSGTLQIVSLGPQVHKWSEDGQTHYLASHKFGSARFRSTVEDLDLNCYGEKVKDSFQQEDAVQFGGPGRFRPHVIGEQLHAWWEAPNSGESASVKLLVNDDGTCFHDVQRPSEVDSIRFHLLSVTGCKLGKTGHIAYAGETTLKATARYKGVLPDGVELAYSLRHLHREEQDEKHQWIKARKSHIFKVTEPGRYEVWIKEPWGHVVKISDEVVFYQFEVKPETILFDYDPGVPAVGAQAIPREQVLATHEAAIKWLKKAKDIKTVAEGAEVVIESSDRKLKAWKEAFKMKFGKEWHTDWEDFKGKMKTFAGKGDELLENKQLLGKARKFVADWADKLDGVFKSDAFRKIVGNLDVALDMWDLATLNSDLQDIADEKQEAQKLKEEFEDELKRMTVSRKTPAPKDLGVISRPGGLYFTTRQRIRMWVTRDDRHEWNTDKLVNVSYPHDYEGRGRTEGTGKPEGARRVRIQPTGNLGMCTLGVSHRSKLVSGAVIRVKGLSRKEALDNLKVLYNHYEAKRKRAHKSINIAGAALSITALFFVPFLGQAAAAVATILGLGLALGRLITRIFGLDNTRFEKAIKKNYPKRD